MCVCVCACVRMNDRLLLPLNVWSQAPVKTTQTEQHQVCLLGPPKWDHLLCDRTSCEIIYVVLN